jgi:hypothetical protein
VEKNNRMNASNAVFDRGLQAMHSDPAIDQIQVGFRYRKDLGDLRPLVDSIAEVGLLHPVVVTPEGRLTAGQRRLEARRTLGWTEVPVTVVDLYQAARGEAHENLVRKDLLPSEIVALKCAIEPLERREARERQGHKADLCHPAIVAEGQGAALEAARREHSGNAGRILRTDGSNKPRWKSGTVLSAAANGVARIRK